MIYIEEMRTKFDELFAWYTNAGGKTPTAPDECFQLYRWFFTIGLSMQHVYYHSGVEDRSKPYSVVELGSGLGASSIIMAKGFQDGNKHCPIDVSCELITVDNGDESDTNLTAKLINKAVSEFGVAIDFHVGNDIELLKTIPDNSIDSLIVDAQHGYDDVTNALNLAPKKVVKNGRIVGHDYDIVEISVVRAVDEWRETNPNACYGWATYDSLWWFIRK